VAMPAEKMSFVKSASKNVEFDAKMLSLVEEINSMETTWKAGINQRFQGATPAFIKSQLGALKGPRLPEIHHDVDEGAIPASYDPRIVFPNCPSLKEIRDQAACGSCWAFGAVEAMTDRICTQSNGTSNVHISAEDLLSCCAECGDGCNGGYPEAAWSHFKTTGLVSGGNYNTKQGCQPYTLPNCDHHTTGQYSPCGDIVPTPKCAKTCEPSYSKSYPADKNFGSTAYSVPANVAQIQTEIMTKGSVEAAFTVFEDFLAYKSGVYQHKSGQALGGHAVKIIGWGVDSGTPYWTVANSWNNDWGSNGFFNILRGRNDCGIEESICAGVVKL